MKIPELINASTRYCAVLGQPVSHSASPAMQNAGMNALGLNWRYLAFEVPPTRLADVIRGCRAMGFIGLNLTVPHKLLALDLVDHIDPAATEWGAVNTIRFEYEAAPGTWRPLSEFTGDRLPETRAAGFNTDADAIIKSLAEDLHITLEGKSVLVLGAGGAGQAAALRIAKSGVKHLHLVNRTETKLPPLLAQIQHQNPDVTATAGYPKTPVDLVINATSLGLRSTDPLPYDSRAWDISDAGAAYDMIYRPAETPLLRAAREAGRPTANGLGMLLHQGAKALELWSGRPAPVDVMKHALHQQVYG